MQIIIQTPGFTSSEALDTLINEKISHLGNYTQNIIRADVTLFKGPETETRNNYCEIRLVVPGNDLFAKSNEAGFEQAVAETVNHLKHMIEKSKDKAVSQRHGEQQD